VFLATNLSEECREHEVTFSHFFPFAFQFFKIVVELQASAMS
jgi:hypothetical protein